MQKSLFLAAMALTFPACNNTINTESNMNNTLQLTQEWDKIVGPMIARNTSDINLKEGVLTVKFRSPLIRNEISMRRTSLQKIINDAIGEEVVQSIVIR